MKGGHWALAIFAFLVFSLSTGAESTAQIQGSTSLTTEASRMDQLAATQGGAKVIDKLSSDFSSFLGTDAQAVVTGLRNGTPIALVRTAPSPTPGAPPVTTTTTTITPPTGKMGFGNVFISLALARQQLGQLGIAQPTPEQLQAALLGGTITTGSGTTATTTNLQGILTMRSQNMGWGEIAQRLGVKLGAVVSGLKAANQSLTARAAAPKGSGIVDAGGQPAGPSESGIVTGSGRAMGKGLSGKQESGEGIVTGSGRPVGAPSGITTGGGRGSGFSGGRSPGKGHD